ncbi:UNVERIFIED_CONTAM: hypothetical protein ABIC26_003073 [Paenibacillus sp. PvR008]
MSASDLKPYRDEMDFSQEELDRIGSILNAGNGQDGGTA